VCHFKQSFCLLWPNTIAQRFDICIGRLKGLAEAFVKPGICRTRTGVPWCKAALCLLRTFLKGKKFSIKSKRFDCFRVDSDYLAGQLKLRFRLAV
jgi:hypothetical protein